MKGEMWEEHIRTVRRRAGVMGSDYCLFLERGELIGAYANRQAWYAWSDTLHSLEEYTAAVESYWLAFDETKERVSA